jgi:urease accessory protein UreH
MTEVRLASRAALLLADSWAVGRIARGERWRFDELDISLCVADDRGLLFKDRCLLDGRSRLDGLGHAEAFPYIATFVAIAPVSGSWESVAMELAELVASTGTGRFGASALRRGGLVGRLLCPSAPALEAALLALWTRCRARLFGLGPLALRKL